MNLGSLLQNDLIDIGKKLFFTFSRKDLLLRRPRIWSMVLCQTREDRTEFQESLKLSRSPLTRLTTSFQLIVREVFEQYLHGKETSTEQINHELS